MDFRISSVGLFIAIIQVLSPPPLLRSFSPRFTSWDVDVMVRLGGKKRRAEVDRLAQIRGVERRKKTFEAFRTMAGGKGGIASFNRAGLIQPTVLVGNTLRGLLDNASSSPSVKTFLE
jgi:hypothetical protein